MKTVTKFISESGREFDNEPEAQQDELYFNAVKKTTELFYPTIPMGLDFANGEGYIQLSEDRKQKILNAFDEIIKTFHPNLVGKPVGYIARYLDDNKEHARRLDYLIACIDDNNRLWGQPFFTGKQGGRIMIAVSELRGK